MAEKSAVLIKYQYLDFVDSADLSDADFGLLIRGVINYDKTGNEPKFKKKNMSLLFSIIKSDIDCNKKKWEETVKAKSESGKKGMEKRWGEKKDNITPITENNTNNTCYQDITDITPVIPVITNITEDNRAYHGITKITDSGSGSGSDLDSEFVYESGGGSESPPQKNKNKKNKRGNKNRNQAVSTAVSTTDKRITPTLADIAQEAARFRFYIDPSTAQSFLDCGLDSEWLGGPNSFIEFSAGRVKEKYADKPGGEQKALFIAAVKSKDNSWDDLRQEYPAWLANKEKAEIAAKVKAAKDNRPSVCKCGGQLVGNGAGVMFCKKCRERTRFNNETLEWVYQKGVIQDD